jgi:SAM-dependent methyltransferase
MLPLLYPDGWAGRKIVDLGCLEGGYATEFARLGLDSTGIEIRESNIANAEYIRSKTNLPNLRFVRDDAWNVGKYGPFDIVFCVGLHYHIEDQLRFLQEMSRACGKAIFIDTHVAPEFDDDPAVTTFNLSELTVHEGLPGRWYYEHDLDTASGAPELEKLKWASWSNRRSFWPTKGGLIFAMRTAGFAVVVEDFDQLLNNPVQALSPQGWNYRQSRAMFVGIKTGEAVAPPPARLAAHPLDGREGRAQAGDEALRAEIVRQRAALDAVYASTSWRLTAPLRALVSRFKS